MNIWDVVIILAVAGVAVFGMVRAKRHRGSCCNCEGCPHADGCGKKDNPNSK